ncbi:MAG: hypothetical protein IPK57_18065 [Chitinophagaceae bacterium]|nr:hypothetical protein [Chitinophagaceae bacterium]
MRYIRQILLPVLFLLVSAGAVKAQPGANEIDQATEQTMQLLEQLFGEMEGFEEGVGPAFEAFRNGMGIVRDGLNSIIPCRHWMRMSVCLILQPRLRR